MLSINVPELSKFRLTLLSYFDFIHVTESGQICIKAFFQILDPAKQNTNRSFDESLRTSEDSIVIDLPVGILSSVRCGSVFENGGLISSASNWYSRVSYENCSFAEARRFTLKEYYLEEFGKDYFRFLPEIFESSNVTILKKSIVDENSFIDMDIIIPDSVLFLRFGGLSRYSIESILQYGLPADKNNPIYYNVEEETSQNKITLFLKKSIPSDHAPFWASCIFYPTVREKLNGMKLQYQALTLDTPKAFFPFNFEWPLKEVLENIHFVGREVYRNNKLYFVVSSIGEMVNTFSKSGIKIVFNRENDSRKKEDKSEAKEVKKNAVIPKNKGGNIGAGKGMSGNQDHKTTEPTGTLHEWLRNLPGKEMLDVEKQKWLTKTNPIIKEFNDSNIGNHDSQSDDNGFNDQNEIPENDYYYAFPLVFEKILKKFPESSYQEYHFIDDQNTLLNLFEIFKNRYGKLSLASVEFCFKPKYRNLKRISSRRRRRYYVAKIIVKNQSFHVLEIEPKRGCSSYCYIFKSKALEDVQSFLMSYVKKGGDEEDITGNPKYLTRIKHPVRYLKGKNEEKARKKYARIMSRYVIDNLL